MVSGDGGGAVRCALYRMKLRQRETRGYTTRPALDSLMKQGIIIDPQVVAQQDNENRATAICGIVPVASSCSPCFGSARCFLWRLCGHDVLPCSVRHAMTPFLREREGRKDD